MKQQDNYISVGALAAGFAPESYLLPQQDVPGGETWRLFCQDGRQFICQFLSGHLLQWQGGPPVSYRMSSLRAGTALIDFADPERKNSTISLVCDRELDCFTAVWGSLPDAALAEASLTGRLQAGLPLTAVDVSVCFGRLSHPCNGNDLLHHETHELVGYRNQYRYSPHECYEHIYLNAQHYVWHCLRGSEQGLADVDTCRYIRVAEQLYLFIWQEKIVPTLGVILIDMQAMRTDGKILGYVQRVGGEVINFPVGAHARVVSRPD